jgi:hypothetical protein
VGDIIKAGYEMVGFKETVYSFRNGLEKFKSGLDENCELCAVEATFNSVLESTPKLTKDGSAVVNLSIAIDTVICLEYSNIFKESRGRAS